MHTCHTQLSVPTEEITLWIQHVYRKYAIDDAEEHFPEYDTDGDGIVTWGEYNTVAHEQLIRFDDGAAVEENPEQESLRHVGTVTTMNHVTGGSNVCVNRLNEGSYVH